MKEEIWKTVYDFEHYQISTWGNVKKNTWVDSQGHQHQERFLKPFLIGAQRVMWAVMLSKNGRQYPRRIHRLIGEAFIPNPKNHPYIQHKDGDKNNNYVDNLEWISIQDYTSNAVRFGHIDCKGEKNPKAKLTEKEVFEIRKLSDQGMTQRSIAELFLVSKATVGEIVIRDTWKHI